MRVIAIQTGRSDFLDLDSSAACGFLKYLEGERELSKVLSHPAYQAIFSHAQNFGVKMTEEDVEKALDGDKSPFYGMSNLKKNLPRIEKCLEQIEKGYQAWVNEIRSLHQFFFPGLDLSRIKVFPVIGYDIGIGHKNSVCLNINVETYLNDYREFFCMIAHEGFHALYEQIHNLPSISDIMDPEKRLDVFYSMTQNEGYAVFSAWLIREGKGFQDGEHPVLKDYFFLREKQYKLWSRFKEVEEKIRKEPDMELKEYMDLVFGAERLTYRIGSLLIDLIKENLGKDKVKKGIYMPGKEFFNHYRYLFETRF